ncbi:MAG: ATP-dependent helicase [Terriglobia bacterium]
MLELNPEQRQAVEHGEGPLLIIAGPGSGKTRVITERIVYLLENVPGLQPTNILAVTFTDKAAAEMKERVRKALASPPELPHISTFHSFCYEVLRKRHFERRLLDKVDVWIFLRQRMTELGLDFYQKLAEPGAFLHDLNDFFSRCQDELIEPGDFEAFVAKVEKAFQGRAPRLDAAERKLEEEEVVKKKELARVFRNSRRLIEEAGCSSLGSLISETVRLFDREPEVLPYYHARFRYVLVDEFQDTNFAQVELLRRLVAAPYNITAVGDDDQAIYRFRGAAHGAFQMFHQAFEGAKVVNLHRNYRSTRRILSAADVVIAKNTHEEKKKPLRTEHGEGDRIFLLESPDYVSEAAWIAGEIERLHRKESRRFGDIAVLYRAHSHRDPLVDQFRRRNIPFAIRGLSILSTVILRDLLAYLNLIHSPHNNISLTRVLLAPRWRFPESLSLELRKNASKNRCSLHDALETWEKAPTWSALATTGWGELKSLLADLRNAAARLPVTDLYDRMIEQLGLTFVPGDSDGVYASAFRKFLEGWEAKSETRKLNEFMEYFQYFRDAGGKVEFPEPESPANAVQMMTAHAAKGLEFPFVFILSVAPRRFPHSEQKPVIEFPDELRKGPEPPPDIHLQEERRLFFVAMTRAEERLYVSSVVKPGKKPSAFVGDLLSNPAVTARDIERVQVPQAPSEVVLPPVPPRVARSEPQMREVQPGLFSDTAAEAPSVHPDVAGWAGKSPPIAPDGRLQLSATAIEDYLSCPLKFKFGHVLKIATGPQPALTFGNIMHQSVRHYFELRRKSLPTFEAIEEFYLRAWRDAGFEDVYQEQSYKKAGLEQLRAFVARQNPIPVAGEQVHTEIFFRFTVGEVELEGRIDQINPVDGQGGQAEELVDYKTGRPRSQKDADKSLQLSIYALAAREQLRLKPARLTFYNLTNNQPVSTVRTDKDLDEALATIREVAEQIRSLLFPPTPGYVCRWCDFVPVCPAHEESY